jgi:hypothetical protein
LGSSDRMAYLDTSRLLLAGAALALLALGSWMALAEAAALRAGRPYLTSWVKKQNYWMAYFCAFVLGATLLLKATIAW